MAELDIIDVTKRVVASQSIAELTETFDAAVSPLGMTAFASGMVTGRRALGPNPFHFMKWPADWLAHYQAEGFVKIDPLPRWAIVEGEAVSWEQVTRRLPPNDIGLTVMHAANARGFYDGFVTPVRAGGGALGLVSVAGGKRGDFDLDERIYLQAISTAALMRGEALLGDAARPPSGTLTLREGECVSLLAHGFQDAEIAAALAISITTVRSHLNNTREKLGVRNRVELANLSWR